MSFFIAANGIIAASARRRDVFYPFHLFIYFVLRYTTPASAVCDPISNRFSETTHKRAVER